MHVTCPRSEEFRTACSYELRNAAATTGSLEKAGFPSRCFVSRVTSDGNVKHLTSGSAHHISSTTSDLARGRLVDPRISHANANELYWRHQMPRSQKVDESTFRDLDCHSMSKGCLTQELRDARAHTVFVRCGFVLFLCLWQKLT